ncbi:hypothetical protein EYV94_24370 [Puteibacter caeruleilacunae]|nr:hypothetical protein EYV94_24370 [Puteibacter caeruleilacunae]
MKTIINRYLLIFLSAIILFSCSDEENPFVGGNADIISFALTVEGVKYPASISGTDIVIAVPQSIKLASASVEYQISENASVQPDPNTVTNWDEEQIFRVNAWNDEYESYTYTVKRTDVVDPDNVVLLTQADVVEFAKKKVTRISGNLILGHTTIPAAEFDTIKDLTPLSTLTAVDLNIVINNSATDCNHGGLNNIKKAGGLYFGSLTEQAKATKVIDLELYNLETVNQLVINSDSLQSISFPKLKSVDKVYINTTKLKTLDLSLLEKCAEDFTLKAVRNGNYAEKNSNTSMRTISLPKLNAVGGNLLIENFWEVKELNLSQLNTVDGDLQLQYIRSIPEISLPELTEVANLLNIKNNDGMTEFSANKLNSVSSVYISSLNVFSLNLAVINLPVLNKVEEDFTIRFASSVNLELPELGTIGGVLQIESAPFLESVSVPKLTACDRIELLGTKSLSSFDNPQMTELNSLELGTCSQLKEFKTPAILSGDVDIDFGGKDYAFPNLNSLEEIEGTLALSSCGAKDVNIASIKKINKFYFNYSSEIESLSFADLEEVIDDFEISSLGNLATFSAPKLSIVGNDLIIKGCLILTDIHLSKLATVTGQFKFYGGSSRWQASRSIIENMDAFAHLTSAGSVDIRYAGKLSDYSGLKNVIDSLTEDNWSVQECLYNPDYAAMKQGQYSNN